MNRLVIPGCDSVPFDQPDANPRHVSKIARREYRILRQKNRTYVDVSIREEQMLEIMLAVVSYDSTKKPTGILELREECYEYH